jgi:hypothetical protein
MVVLLEVHVPPVAVLLKVDVLPAHTLNVPDIASSVGEFTVTVLVAGEAPHELLTT